MKKISVYIVLVALFLVCESMTIAPVTSSSTPPEDIAYENRIKTIIQNYCSSCHTGKMPAAGISLTSYEEVRYQAEKGALLQRINDPKFPMPKGGLMPLKERKAIAKWAKNGFKKSVEVVSDSSTISDQMGAYTYIPPQITPANIDKKGFVFFDLMRGHWVGNLNIMGQQYDWFSFDYRPISASHVFGIYEGGTMGNLFTSFFVTNYKGKRTIMARNGGVLNGIYRTSYFVLDKVEITNGRKYFRFIDAYGGQEIMWMELEFIGNKLQFNSYTSRFGLNGKPKLHMQFSATKKHVELSDALAKQLGYPQNTVQKDFADGLPKPIWGEEYTIVTSASYMYQDADKDLIHLGKLSGDPYTIEEIPYLANLTIEIEQNEKIEESDWIIYLSQSPLTDPNGRVIMEYGFIKQELSDGVLHFPTMSSSQKSFTFNYLHPGNYYITVVADLNKDGYISKGDINSPSKAITVKPKSIKAMIINDILMKN